MPWNLTSTHAQAGDIAQLVGLRHKHFIITLVPGGELHTHRGIVYHDEVLGASPGSRSARRRSMAPPDANWAAPNPSTK